jgi:SpoVK/Ycf46/Vps4 family AAA+-type ATPase
MWFSSSKEEYFKFVSLKTYAWDRTINNKRKFRSVFDRSELNYLSVAFEFYNKKFDEKDWKTVITFKAFTLENDEKTTEHCSDSTEHTISKDENTVIIDYGYGNDEHGSYWPKGSYIWEVYMDDDLVATTKFYVEDMGKVTTENNPYFKIESIKTYENPGDDDPEENRFYVKTFDQSITRYVMTELTFVNLVQEPWLCELFFNYYDDSGMFIGVSKIFNQIEPYTPQEDITTVVAGYGFEDPGHWLKDTYRIEVVFMDTLVALIPFKIGDKIVERISGYDALINDEVDFIYWPEKLSNSYASNNVPLPNPEDQTDTKPEENVEEVPQTKVDITPSDDRPLEAILEELNGLIGLDVIKERITEYVDYLKFLKIRQEKGLEQDSKINLHSVFTGNPGTGKTTVVKLLGGIFKALGLLSKGSVLTVESNDLVSGYVRQTGKNTKEVIEKARGGILFIDEAYMLYKDGSTNDFGAEAIAALITEMSDGPGDIAIMMAGYPNEMELLINSNPGLKSRLRNHYHFDDYTPNELLAIALYSANKKHVTLSEEAVQKLKSIITEAFRKRDKTFGNARFANALIDEAKINLGIRLVRNHQPSKLTKTMLTRIEAEDIEDITKKNLNKRLNLDIDMPLLKEALVELENLIGLQDIKEEVQNMIKLTQYYKELKRDVLKVFSLHSVFLGNPGTGKTTVARIIGKVYKALGLLERGHLVEVDASDLIAGYVGQTAIKTKAVIDKAMGGILFIDEAYAISEGTGNSASNDFGSQAIAALIKEMEDHRGEFAVIVAGYTQNMQRFLESNPGIKSRFDRTFMFKDFSEAELWEIAFIMLNNKKLKLDAEAEAHLKAYISHLYNTRNRYFGNARSIRKIIEKTIRNQELRMANLPKNKRSKALTELVTLDDVSDFDASKTIQLESRRPIGYRS